MQQFRLMGWWLYNISDSNTTEQFVLGLLTKESNLHKNWIKNGKLRWNKEQQSSDISSAFF